MMMSALSMTASNTAVGNVVTNDNLSADNPNLLKSATFGNTTKSFGNPDGTDAGGKFVLLTGTSTVTLKIYENGAYTYTVNANNVGNHTEQFTYVLRDFDADTDPATPDDQNHRQGPGRTSRHQDVGR
jgi:hypothetical protein